MKKLLLLILLLSSGVVLFAQGEDVHNHVHGRNEIGVQVRKKWEIRGI